MNFDYLKPFNVVAIVGPQRSGTTIAGRIISHELHRKWVDESSKLKKNKRIKDTLFHYVWNCPAQTRWCHIFGDDDRVAVILIRRNIDDIIASQNRINWNPNANWELKRYNDVGYFEGNIAEVKYDYWDRVQKDLIRHPYEIEYESFSEHEFWVEKELRKNFGAKQTQV